MPLRRLARFATTQSDYPGATTGKDSIATAFLAHSTDLVQHAATVLGRQDAAEYTARSAAHQAGLHGEFCTAGRVGENTQTAYALALQFDLLPDDLRAEAGRGWPRTIAKTRGHLPPASSARHLCHGSRARPARPRLQVLNRQEYPSWLYPVKQGATTIWERWDGQKPDGSSRAPA